VKDTLIILAAIAVIVLFPLAFIWCLNTLFSLGIAYTFLTWLASLGLMSVLGSQSVSKS
jgi:hypothetical protein